MLRSTIASTMGITSLGFLVSFASQIVISYHFGASAELDAYWVAFALMNLLAFPLMPLREALVPEFHRRLQQDAKTASAYFARAMTLILLVAIFGALIGWIFANPLASLAVSENQPAVRDLAVGQLYWLAPAVILLAFSETLNSIMASYHRVILQAFARLLGLTATLVVLASVTGLLKTHALPLSIIAGQAAIAFVQIAALRREQLGFRFAWPGGLGKRFLAVSGALLATQAAIHGYVIFEKHTLTSFSAGLVSSFQYSVALTNVLITLVGVSLANVLWPRFLDHAAGDQHEQLYADVSVAVRFTLLFMGWLCTLVWLNATPLVELIYARGAFDASAVARTSDALRVAVFAAAPISIGMLMSRALVSLGSARSVMVAGIATTLTGCIVLLSARFLENPTLALSHWLIANLVGMATYALLLSRVCGVRHNAYGRVLWWMGRWSAILLIAGGVSQMIPSTELGGAMLVLGVLEHGTVFTCMFLLLAWLLGMFRDLPAILKRSPV